MASQTPSSTPAASDPSTASAAPATVTAGSSPAPASVDARSAPPPGTPTSISILSSLSPSSVAGSSNVPSEVAFGRPVGLKPNADDPKNPSNNGYTLRKPPGSKKSPWWKFYHIYDRMKHKDMECKACCNICFANINIKNSTSALSSHIKAAHFKDAYLPETNPNYGVKHNPAKSISKQVGAVTKLSPAEYRQRLLQATVAWVVDTNQPFNAVEQPSFRQMMNIAANKAGFTGVNVPTFSNKDIRLEVMTLGTICKEAVKQKLKGQRFAVTTDHWTSANDETYSCLTAHWIDKDWTMERCVLAFEVFHGSTSGELLGKDFKAKFDEYKFEPWQCLACVTDTTGNMNTFGVELRLIGVDHIYCVDHNLHLNAKLAFDGEFDGLDSMQHQSLSSTC